MVKSWFEIFDIKPWFENFDFDIKADIRYTDKGGQIKPYLSAFSVNLGASYYPKFEDITIAVFPQSGKLELIYANRDNYVIAKVPIKYTEQPDFTSVAKIFDYMDIPDYVKDYLMRVLKLLLDKIYVREDLLKFLYALNEEDVQGTNALDDKLSKITQTIHVHGTIYDKGDGRKDIGRVNIYDYFAVNDKTEYNDIYDYFYSDDENKAEYYVVDKSFEVQKSSDGELTAIVKYGGTELFDPTYQVMLSVIIPTEREFEELVGFVKDIIKKEGEVEYGDKNIIS